jgi:uncharacterized circularly permuted ATP-grasp superfamily protein/uncharacterized alpha-E superfamily protein
MPEQNLNLDFLNKYKPAANSYNEIAVDGNVLHPEWHSFFSSLGKLDSHEIENRANNIQRLLKENGVAYNIYIDSSGGARPWELDPIPQIISVSEWQKINSGLIQRAQLFSMILKDIYGQQNLIKDGIIPQELIYRHPGFLRSCVNLNLPNQDNLILYSTDLGRGKDGNLWTISDRAQAPSGYGYAMENRLAMSKVLPELFSDNKVSRLYPFFEALQRALNNIAPNNVENPRIVILTPGSENETYFEHSYLSAYLGLSLVQGTDLMVKDNYVWIKTIEGLEKVDVILRRMDDIYCDPLELKSDSLLGVPGLLHVIRKGNVSIANPLGSSVIENAGLIPFLNKASKYLLGTDLILPSIATWWCGQPNEMNYVINNLAHLVVRRIYRRKAGVSSAIDGDSLTAAQKEELIREIKANPHLFAGQEKIGFSSTPSWVNGELRPGHSLIRSFLVKNGDSFMAMPGGLTRTSYVKDSFIISNQSGGISKDTWVISSGSDNVRPSKSNIKSTDPSKYLKKDSLPSHTAENIYWVGRYSERLINNARLLHSVMQYVLLNSNQSDENTVSNTKKILLETLTHTTYGYPGFVSKKDYNAADLLKNPWPELSKYLYDDQKDGSLSKNLLYFRKSIYNVRNFLSVDTWRIVRHLDDVWSNVKNNDTHDRLIMMADIDKLNTSVFAILGMNRENVRRAQEWVVLELGRKIEQALFSINFLQNIFKNKTDEQTEHDLLQAVLIATQSMVSYRFTYRDHLQLSLLLEMLVLDMNYPKSLVYLISKIISRVNELPKVGNNESQKEAEFLMLEALSLLKTSNGISLSNFDFDSGEYEDLHNIFDKVSDKLYETSAIITKTYFKHTLSHQQLYVT